MYSTLSIDLKDLKSKFNLTGCQVILNETRVSKLKGRLKFEIYDKRMKLVK